MLDVKVFCAGLGPPADGASSNGDAWNTSDIANASLALSAADEFLVYIIGAAGMGNAQTGEI